jgi:hypothetical protein
MADLGPERTELTATELADIEGMLMLIEGGTLYQRLKVRDDADRRAIRDAYFRLSKQFHPDAFYGRRLEGYRERLEEIFRALTHAYDVLSNKHQRAEYDRSIGLDPMRPLVPSPVGEAVGGPDATGPRAAMPQRSQSGMQQAVHPPSLPTATQRALQPPSSPTTTQSAAQSPSSPTATQRALSSPTRPMEPLRPPPLSSPSERGSVTAPRPAIGHTPSVSPSSMTPPSEEVQRAAREALARKLAGGRTLSQGAIPAVQPPGAVSAGASLQAQFTNRPELAQRAKIQSLLTSVRELVARGDFLGACNLMQVVRAMAPDDRAIEDEAKEIQKLLLAQQAPKNAEAAREAERARQFEQAATLWGKVAAVKPDEFEPQLHLGRCLLALGREFPRAAEAARRAIAAAPRRVEGHLLLAEIFEAAGKPASARNSAEQAAKLDPSSPAVKELLARLR